ncbi:hypothetical protein B0T20DRAFT_200269 [Sordaria brevicollis]|uniref:Uncharacterized protein n=1 Tax=Sordaria brevicollis TaxID=83679 RepID=A0AAE0PGI4_SORBR|nr:hypothetical protein B0T20DRAFT_200269 [Sordaria brevicollis]
MENPRGLPPSRCKGPNLTMAAKHMSDLEVTADGVHFEHVRSLPTLSEAYTLLAHLEKQVRELNQRAADNNDTDVFSFVYVVPSQPSVVDATTYLQDKLRGCTISRNKVVARQNTLSVIDYYTILQDEAFKLTRRSVVVFDLNCGWITASAAGSLATLLQAIHTVYKTGSTAITCLTVANTSVHAWSKHQIKTDFDVDPQDYISEPRQAFNGLLSGVKPFPGNEWSRLDCTAYCIIKAFDEGAKELFASQKLVVVCSVAGWSERDAITSYIRKARHLGSDV